MPPVNSGESEAKWHALVDEVMALPQAVMQAAADFQGNSVHFDDFPAAAAVRLQHTANLQLRAICLLLRDGESSSVAYGLIRGLLEIWAHLYWICDAPESSWECRGIQVGLMLALEGVNSARGIPEELRVELGDGDIVQREESIAVLTQLAMDRGCTAKARPGNAEASLKDIARKTGLSWVLVMWRYSSLNVHALSIEWSLHDLGDGNSAVASPPLSELAARLDHALTAYANCAEHFLVLDGSPDAAERLRAVLEEFRCRSLYLELLAGTHDANTK
jgi:hypothetical protein